MTSPAQAAFEAWCKQKGLYTPWGMLLPYQRQEWEVIAAAAVQPVAHRLAAVVQAARDAIDHFQGDYVCFLDCEEGDQAAADWRKLEQLVKEPAP